jgi:catechol 2,3-dioxygenase-like lactoylglutathione lyase family enzyme
MRGMAALFTRVIPILFVADLQAERDFYVRLGFGVTYQGPEYPYFIALGHGAVEFGIEWRQGFSFAAPDRVLTWQLGVSDIDKAKKQLADAGVPFREELMAPSPDWQYRVVHVRTPNGYHLLLEEGSA